MYFIEDWAGNRICPDKSFPSFEAAWDYICDELSQQLGLTEEDMGEYYVQFNTGWE